MCRQRRVMVVEGEEPMGTTGQANWADRRSSDPAQRRRDGGGACSGLQASLMAEHEEDRGSGVSEGDASMLTHSRVEGERWCAGGTFLVEWN